ncbi:thioesterase family protein [Actinopolyspora mortivallis]|uniref:Thioesterase family protein n=1 Tax=Actinopolyspora mortivallis TaxID=33906 RepID=A0A2T0H236_ACTMO|nr:thioesterase family protein [Actinopolyspora mortivallis]PRW65431.1 thioesterase family protein [Actinopolyspora mortivallis]
MDTSAAEEAFYEPLGRGRYRATEHTVGPWSDKAQHLGPVAALLVRGVEQHTAESGRGIRRVTVDVLGPVPVDEVEIRCEVSRPGRSVELVTTEISAGGRVAALARAWLMRRADTTEVASDEARRLPAPESCGPMPLPAGWSGGYARALDWRNANTSEPGPGGAAVWGRPRLPLVAGERPSPLQRLFAVADCSSGVSSPLPFEQWAFANTDLTVHLSRDPMGEWVGLDAQTAIGPDGAGLTHSTLHDATGPVGRSAQALMPSRV